MPAQDYERKLRLQVALARLGFASRRAAAEFIRAGRVKVNGKIVREPGERVSLGKDKLTLDGKSKGIQEKVYFLLNKPPGVVTTVKDRYAARTVLDIIKGIDARIYPVGRLDKDTSGLLILTNDGELAYRLTHPKFAVKKVYLVRVKGIITRTKIKRLEQGILLEGKKTFPCKIKLLSVRAEISALEVQLTEGRNRQIKKMFKAAGHPVLRIHRIAFGPLRLSTLKPGQWRPLKQEEVSKLKRH